ncbi:hypothetical protein FRC03_011033 [Tulasnella sp. 419]|nr:hypothetical protein FRC03_011033 [Tulasnella sp. 419]
MLAISPKSRSIRQRRERALQQVSLRPCIKPYRTEQVMHPLAGPQPMALHYSPPPLSPSFPPPPIHRQSSYFPHPEVHQVTWVPDVMHQPRHTMQPIPLNGGTTIIRYI